MLEEKVEVVRETDDWLHGKLYARTEDANPFVFMSDFMKPKEALWFAHEPRTILRKLGIEVERQRAIELENLFEGRLDGFYYLEAVATLSGDPAESVKWLLGGVAAYLNETGQSIKNIETILPSSYLAAFVKYLSANKFPRSFAKDVFGTLIGKGGRVFAEYPEDDIRHWTEPTRFVSGEELMDEIVAMPQFKAADDSVIDGFIDQVIAANPEQAAKIGAQPKLLQWMVGQTMKLAKGKAPASDVLAKLKARFNVE